MKLKSLSLGVVAALAISAAPAYAITDAQQAIVDQAVAAQSGSSAAEQVASIFGQCVNLGIGAGASDCSEAMSDIVASVITADPASAEEAVQAAIAIAPEATDAIVASAVTVAPESAGDIVAAAVAAGASVDDVVTAAVLAGADPTTLTDAAAAGTTTTRRLRSTSGSGISGN
ncbi:hypothetical protein ACXJY6_14755 [Vibrio sp. RC27]